MEAVLGVLLTSCVAIFGVIDGWFGQKIYDFATWAFAQLVEYFVLASIKFLLVVIPFAWDVGRTILADLDVKGFVSSAWNSLPGDVASVAGFFGIPECINIIMTALATRFVLRFIPGMR